MRRTVVAVALNARVLAVWRGARTRHAARGVHR